MALAVNGHVYAQRCGRAQMDGRWCANCKTLQVVLLEWLWERWGLNLPLQNHDQWACEHLSVRTQTHLLTHVHLGSQSSLNRPLTVACLARGARHCEDTICRRMQLTHRPSISLTRCCESSDNLLSTHSSLLLQVVCLAISEPHLRAGSTCFPTYFSKLPYLVLFVTVQK